MLKKYKQFVKKINSLNFDAFDDIALINRVNEIKIDLINSYDKFIPELFAIIKEIIDRRLGIWKLFDSELPSHLNIQSIQKTYNEVKEKKAFIETSKIHLNSSFYADVRNLRRQQDSLTFMPYNVQLMGGLALLDGKIAEMGTGEGKTVVAVFPACIWALSGKKVHIATVNDYLALRDCIWMSPVYKFLGLEADCILSQMTDPERQQSYKADIVYGNNYEFGFDYLRDNVKSRFSDKVQSKLEYAIIDEIDSVLMDEATTPLIISGMPDENKTDYWKFRDVIESLLENQNIIIEKLFKEFETEDDQETKIIKLIQISLADPWNNRLQLYLSDKKDLIKKMDQIHSKFIAGRSEYKLEEDLLYVIDERQRTVKLTDYGVSFIEKCLGKGFLILKNQERWEHIYLKNEQVRNLIQLLQAYTLYKRDEDYIVHKGKIIIVDEWTGRLAYGKKYEEGLHQAIECKENVQITPENRVMGKITHPNYFRLYKKMTGMTATAHTEAEEFKNLYKLEVIRIPTNKPVIRVDLPDKIYKTEEEKIKAVIDDIKDCYNIGRPVLIGTRSVEKSENLSKILTNYGIPHNVLNAKNHSEEAEIIKNAGQPFAVTIATNMAGRGTDIILGKGVDLGLHVIGTERHYARRIDDQLIGRAGRQGDRGTSIFYLSLQDELIRVYADEDMIDMIKALESSQTKKLEKIIRKAQKKSEETSYAIRKQLIEHDDVIDRQRKVIYKMRNGIIAGRNTKKRIKKTISGYIDDLISQKCTLEEIKMLCAKDFSINIEPMDIEPERDILIESFQKQLEMREQAFGEDFSNKLEKAVLLEALDNAWADFLSLQNEIDKSIMLRSFVKSDVIVDYKIELVESFRDLLASIRYETLKNLFTYPLPREKANSLHRQV